MFRTQRSLYSLFLFLVWPLEQSTIVSAQKKPECSTTLPSGAFDSDVDLKILITGFGYPDDRADLFGNRYATAVQSFVIAPKDRGTASVHAAPTLKGRLVRYLPCEVSSHSAARQLGQQLGADVVLWGMVQWRNWQGGSRQADPSAEASDKASPSAHHPAATNTFSGSVGQVQQNFISLAGTTTAMIMPYLTAVQFTGLEVEAEHPVQISDNKDLKNESFDTLLAPPHLALIHFLLGHYAAEHGDYEVASQNFKIINDHMGGQSLNLLSQARDAVTILNQIGNSLIRNKNYSIAVPYLQRAVERCNSTDIHCLAEENYLLGVAHQKNGALDQAISQFDKALELWKQTQRKDRLAEIFFAIGKIYQERDEYDGAIYHIKQQILLGETMGEKYQSQLAEGYLMLGELYNITEQYKKSVQPLSQAVKIFQKLSIDSMGCLAQAYHDLGVTYANQQDYTNAVEFYQNELEILKKTGNKRRIAEAYETVALTFNRLGDMQEASNRYQVAADYYQSLNPPEYASARNSLALALILCNQRLSINNSCRLSIQKKLAALPN